MGKQPGKRPVNYNSTRVAEDTDNMLEECQAFFSPSKPLRFLVIDFKLRDIVSLSVNS